ncbi:MAG: class A beta-lactamase [Hydrogenovibrio sp.]|nr:class A beta-lactamase [Hydrogenovibrio sp.]
MTAVHKTSLFFSLFCLWLISPVASAEPSELQNSFAQQMAQLEQEFGGRLGVAILNTEDDTQLHYHADQRFAMCSTAKFLLVSAVLAKVDAKQESMNRMVRYHRSDLLSYAPITRQYLQGEQGEMTIAQLSAAAIEYSDNTAANLLLNSIGGPQAVTDYLRRLGDRNTRLDRIEPYLNSNIPNDLRDTSTPASMTELMHKLLVGNALSSPSKEQLTTWLLNNTTGTNKLRAGIPNHWPIGDKTGSGSNGASNDIAILWPDSESPVLIAVYHTDTHLPAESQNQVFVEVGRIVSQMLAVH